MAPPAGRPPALTLDQIADAVIAVGFKDFTVGKVAAELGVDYTTLYRYAPHRDALVTLGLDRLVRLDGITLYGEGDEALSWRDLVDRAAHRVWDFLERYPYVATEMAKVIYPSRVFELAAALAEALVERGFRVDDAVLALDLSLDLAVNTRSGAEYLDTALARTAETSRRSLAEHAKGEAADGSTTRDEIRRAFARMVETPPKQVFEDLLRVALDGIEAALAPPSAHA